MRNFWYPSLLILLLLGSWACQAPVENYPSKIITENAVMAVEKAKQVESSTALELA